jgi:hypothetical protein
LQAGPPVGPSESFTQHLKAANFVSNLTNTFDALKASRTIATPRRKASRSRARSWRRGLRNSRSIPPSRHSRI